MGRIRQQYPQNYASSGNISTEFENLIRYLNAAELGNKTLSELLGQLYDSDGVFDGPVEMRRNQDGALQYRIGEYTDDAKGWKTLVTAEQIRGEPGQQVGEIGEPLVTARADITATAGQTTFAYAHTDEDELLVYVDGVLQVEGASADYEHDDTAGVAGQIEFTSGLNAGQVVTAYKLRTAAISAYKRQDTVTSASQVVFPFIHEDSAQLNVYLNGILQRPGGSYDYVSDADTDTVTFTSTIAAGNTVTIITVENTAKQAVTGMMFESNYADPATGLIKLSKIGIDDDAIPQAKVANLTSDLAATAKLTVSATTPTSPGTGDLWLDTSTTPNRLKFYNGVQWLDTSPEALLPSFASSNAGQLLHVNGTGTGLEYRAVDLSAVVPKTEKGAANGVATLDSNARLPKAQLPTVLGTDSLYTAIASPSATTYTLKRIWLQKVSIQGIAVQTSTGSCSVQIAVNGTGTGSTYTASTTPNDISLGSPIPVDASASAVSIDVIVSGVSSAADLEVSLALDIEAT